MNSAQPAPTRRTSRMVVMVICAIAGAILIGSPFLLRRFVVEAFQVPSGAMTPTLLVGDHFFLNKLPREVHRGDVIVFQFPPDPTTDYVKRVVGVGGDTLESFGTEVTVNGVTLPHRRTDRPCPDEMERSGECAVWEETVDGHRFEVVYETGHPVFRFGPFRVPPGTVFVMGDNRDNSSDSRVWGTVPLDLVKGQPSFVWWSRGAHGVRWNRIGKGIP